MTRNQEIRKEVLMQLYASRRVPVSAALMQRQSKKAGLDYTEEEIAAEADFLVGQGLASHIEDTVSGELKAQITSKGVIEHERSN